MLTQAGFVDIQIQIKPNAEEFIKDWMPGSGAEKVITSAYVSATKPVGHWGFRDDVRQGTSSAPISVVAPAAASAAAPAGGCDSDAVEAGC